MMVICVYIYIMGESRREGARVGFGGGAVYVKAKG